MRMSLLDWVGRVTGLVLAMMVTLSIIGAIAAIPSSSLDGRLGFDRGIPGWDEPRDVRPAAVPPPAPEAGPAAAGKGVVVASPATAPARTGVADQWLEVIAYSLLALVCLGALATLLLWRALRELRRIGERD
jgi:hypothetical protein